MLFGFSLREIASSVIGSLVADALTPGGMAAYAITLVMVVWAAVSWHRRQRAAKKLGMASWQFISLCLVLAALGVGGAGYGFGLHFAKPNPQTPAIIWMLPKAATEKFVPSDRDAAGSLRELLLAGVLIARGTPHYGKAGDSAVSIPAAEWQSLTIAGQDFSSATSKQGPAHSYDNLELAAVGDFTPEFWNVTPNLTQEQKDAITASFRDRIDALVVSNTEKDRELADQNQQLQAKDRELQAAVERSRESDALRARVKQLTDAADAAARGEWRPFPSGAILTRRLIHTEAQGLVEQLIKLTDVVRSTQGMPSLADLLPGGRAGPYFQFTLQKSGLPDAIDRLKKYKAALSDFSNALKATIDSENGKYADDLSRIVGNQLNIEGLNIALADYIWRLETLKTDNDAHPQAPLSTDVLRMALFEAVSRLGGEIGKFNGWSRAFIIERSPAARKEIEAYL